MLPWIKIHDDQVDKKVANFNTKIGHWFVVVLAVHVNSALMNLFLKNDVVLEGCVCYIFGSLYCTSKIEHLWKKEECFSFITSKAHFVVEIIKF